MSRRPPRSTRTDTLFPYTTLFRSTPAGDFEVVRNPAKDLARDDATTFVVSGDRIQLTKDQPAAGLNRMEAVVVGEEFVGATAVVYLEGPGGIEIKAQKSHDELAELDL